MLQVPIQGVCPRDARKKPAGVLVEPHERISRIVVLVRDGLGGVAVPVVSPFDGDDA